MRSSCVRIHAVILYIIRDEAGMYKKRRERQHRTEKFGKRGTEWITDI